MGGVGHFVSLLFPMIIVGFGGCLQALGSVGLRYFGSFGGFGLGSWDVSTCFVMLSYEFCGFCCLAVHTLLMFKAFGVYLLSLSKVKIWSNFRGQKWPDVLDQTWTLIWISFLFSHGKVFYKSCCLWERESESGRFEKIDVMKKGKIRTTS